MADEYISREAATQYFKERSKVFIGHEPIPPALVIVGCANELDAIPAADVREVVTCAKCRYYSEKRKECGHINGLSELVFPTDYCSYGSVMREVSHDS